MPCSETYVSFSWPLGPGHQDGKHRSLVSKSLWISPTVPPLVVRLQSELHCLRQLQITLHILCKVGWAHWRFLRCGDFPLFALRHFLVKLVQICHNPSSYWFSTAKIHFFHLRRHTIHRLNYVNSSRLEFSYCNLNPIGLSCSVCFSRSWSSASLITSICRATLLLNCDSGFKMPKCHLKADTSSVVSSNMKSSGKRSILRCWPSRKDGVFEKCVKTSMNIFIKCVFLPKTISRKCE